MTAPLHLSPSLRPAALVALSALLLAAGCSAPPGADTGEDGVPEFGAFQPSATDTAGTPGAATAPGSNVATNTPSASAGAGGASSEPVGNGGIGLQPASPAPSGSQSQGAGGSAMVAPSAGAAGAAPVGAGGSSLEPNTGSAGSTSMPPSDGNPPPQAPPPDDGNPPAPNDGNPPPDDGNEPAPAPAPSGDCNGAFFCDGFESVAPGATPTPSVWRVIAGFNVTEADPKVTVTAAEARSGAQSLRITEDSGRTGVLATLPQSSYFVRAFFQLDAAPLGTVFIGGGTSENNETRFRIQGQSYATINSVTGGNDPVRPADANSGNGCPGCFTLPVNEWFCAELAIDNAASTATLFINDVEVAVAGPDAFAPQPAQPLLFLGSWGLQGGATGVFIDDVAVGPERFGCN